MTPAGNTSLDPIVSAFVRVSPATEGVVDETHPEPPRLLFNSFQVNVVNLVAAIIVIAQNCPSISPVDFR